MITTLDALIRWLHENVPNFSFGTQNQYKSKSFIRSEETAGTWQGTDGLLWWFNEANIELYDRQGEINPETGRPFRYRAEEVWSKLPATNLPEVDWATVYAQLPTFKRTILREKFVRTHDHNAVQIMHANVQRDYWRQWFLEDTLIDHFMLGYGKEAMPKHPFNRHVIPVKLYNIPNKYTFLTRRAEEGDPMAHKMPAGAPRSLWIGKFGLEIPAEQVETIYYAEGGMALLATQQFGFTPCFTGTHGADYWSDKWTMHLLNMFPSCKEVVFLYDNDKVGKAQMIRIMRSVYYVLHGQSRKLQYKQIIWDDDTPEGYDPADLIKNLSHHAGKLWLEDRLDPVTLEDLEPFRNHNRYLRHAKPYVSEQKVVQLSELRDPDHIRGIQYGMHYFLDETFPRNKNSVYINASYPGSGKNYAIVQVVQTRAERFLRDLARREAERNTQAEEIQAQLEANQHTPEEYEQLKQQIIRLRKPLKRKMAVVASPFRPSFDDMKASHPNFNEEMWFYFESRTPDNCENFEKAERAAQLGYNVSSAVCRFCPFFQKCEEDGYLSQFRKMEEKPIISIRHQHLPIKAISDAKEIFIDEYAGDSLFVQNKTVIRTDDVRLPFGWEEWVSREQIEAIQRFLAMTRGILSEGAFKSFQGAVKPVLMIGRQLFDKMNTQARKLFDCELEDIIHAVEYDTLRNACLTRIEDEMDLFQAADQNWKLWDLDKVNFDTTQELPKRGIDILFRVINEEMDYYKRDTETQPNWNSRISMYADVIEVRPMDVISFNAPVVVTDATPVRAIYERMFPEKEIILYQPLTRNPDTQTTILYGNGFGITEMGKNLKSGLHKGQLVAMNLTKDEFPNDYLRYSCHTIQKLSAQHATLLVISHKMPTVWLQKYYDDHRETFAGTVSFNHYGNVRGLNTYVDYDAVLLVGINRAPHTEVIKEASAWYWNEDKPILPEGKTTYDMAYHDHKVDEEWVDGFQFWGFEDKRLSDIEFGKIEGELKQAANRIRPHTHTQAKHVYMLGSFPAFEFVTHTYEYREWLYGEKAELEGWLREYLRRMYNPQRRYPFPGMKPLRDALTEAGYSMGQTSLAVLKSRLQEEILDERRVLEGGSPSD